MVGQGEGPTLPGVGGWGEVARELSKSSRAMSILYTMVGRWIAKMSGEL